MVDVAVEDEVVGEEDVATEVEEEEAEPLANHQLLVRSLSAFIQLEERFILDNFYQPKRCFSFRSFC